MTKRAGKVFAGAITLAFLVPVSVASAQDLSEKAVKSFMDYAWSLTPAQFSRPDGKTIQIDKKKRDEVMVPVDVAREVIKVGRLSAHAQVCGLADEQKANHRSLMHREEGKRKWTDQQLVYMSQLHLTTVMLLTGKIRLVEKDGEGKEVVVEEGKAPNTSCSDEQRVKVKEMIVAYVKTDPMNAEGPPPELPAAAAGAAPAAAAAAAAAASAKKAEGTTTGSTATAAPTPAAAKPAAGAAPAAKAPEAKAPAPAPEKK